MPAFLGGASRPYKLCRRTSSGLPGLETLGKVAAAVPLVAVSLVAVPLVAVPLVAVPLGRASGAAFATSAWLCIQLLMLCSLACDVNTLQGR